MIIKWLGYSIFGSFFEYILQYFLQVPGFFLLMFLTTMLGLYIIMDLVPETKGVEAQYIYKLFEENQDTEKFLSKSVYLSDSPEEYSPVPTK